MKKFFVTLTAALLLSTTVFAAQSEIILPTVETESNLSVMQALNQRKSNRNFVDKNLTTAQLSKILWAANGVNRPDGKRVIPAALKTYSVEVYAVTSEGIYLYDAPNHKLILVAEGDFRSTTTTGQSFVEKAAVNLVFVETPEVWSTARKIPPREVQLANANISVGAMVQSVALAAQTEGLGNCVRGSINRDEFKRAAKLSDDATILLAQSVGFVE
ncbi:MAG: SagB/ThcOx family dehydrogenase [Selenomonadaceae bacterium]|nr:SagB/ThcOx family dehydrogenase [Selenomonadaceae bacterium]